MIYSVEIKKSAEKEIANLGRADRVRILDRVLPEIARDPHAEEPLKGYQTRIYRRRCGSYRVVYVVNDDDSRVVILKIAHRRDVYAQVKRLGLK